ncbi:unnamed protein product [Prorocentrum cordatum]|nr:unnamed protein product [Polarella glacialis]
MYVGIGYTDWELAERTMDFGSFGATGSSPAVCAGRLSFCLGCRGASVAIDAEAASALACTYWAAESVEAKGNGKHQEMSCALGTHLLMAKHWWPALSASGFLCSKGRCFSFDSAASGYIQGEGVGTLTVRAKKMDGEAEKDFDHISIGTISGGAIGNSGQSAGLYAPHGPGEQQVLTDSCRRSGITPQDVDAVECASTGMLLRDAVEVASCAKALRGCGADEGMPWSGSEPEMLQLGSAKTNTGNLIETSGLVGLIKVFHAIRWNLWPPSQHLRRLNPHMDVSEAPIIMGGECTDPRSRALFMGHSAFGFGGTNVHLHAFGGVDEEVRRPPGPVPESRKPRLTFWPAGGGESARPRKGYFIIGTWGGPDAEPVQMEQEGVGVYGYTMALGENRWEQFQLMLDADEGKVLHPRHCEAWKGCEVLGPDPQEVAEGLAWLIDGRSALPEPPPGEEELVLAEAGTLTETNEDVGVPGDLYRIQKNRSGMQTTTFGVPIGSDEWGDGDRGVGRVAAPPAPAEAGAAAARSRGRVINSSGTQEYSSQSGATSNAAMVVAALLLLGLACGWPCVAAGPLNVGIVGAGPAGLSFALGLRRLLGADVRVRVFDRSDQLRPQLGGGVQLNSGAAVLGRLGLRPELLAAGRPARRVVSRNVDRDVLLDFDMQRDPRSREAGLVGDDGNVLALTIMRDRLQEILAGALPADILEFGKSLADVRLCPGSGGDPAVRCTFEDGDEADFDLLVGADGIRSVVRERVVGGGDEPGNTRIRIIWGVAPAGSRPAGSEEELHQWFGRGCYCLSASYGGRDGKTYDQCVAVFADDSGLPDINPSWDTAEARGSLVARCEAGGMPAEVLRVASACERVFELGSYFSPPQPAGALVGARGPRGPAGRRGARDAPVPRAGGEPGHPGRLLPRKGAGGLSKRAPRQHGRRAGSLRGDPEVPVRPPDSEQQDPGVRGDVVARDRQGRVFPHGNSSRHYSVYFSGRRHAEGLSCGGGAGGG